MTVMAMMRTILVVGVVVVVVDAVVDAVLVV